MIFKLLRLSIDVTDEDFNAIYPDNIQDLARKHWSPVAVAKTASEFLVDRPGTRVLDIGSGAGKFCMVGAAHTRGHFTGIEQREHLVELSTKLSRVHGLHNVNYIHANITSIHFRDYDAFYFFNSFYENIQLFSRIDDSIQLDIQLYHTYSLHLAEQLCGLPRGARLAAYHTSLTSVPGSFKLVDSLYGGSLKLWEKIF